MSVNQLSWHRVVFRVRSPIAQTREPLKFSERHGCAAPLLCGYSCTRSGAAGQGSHHRVIQLSCLGRKQCRFPLGTPGSSVDSGAGLEPGVPRDNQAKTENSMAL